MTIDDWPFPSSRLEDLADEAGLDPVALRDYGRRLEAWRVQHANTLQTNAGERDDTTRDDEPPSTPEPPATEAFPVTGGHGASRPTEKLQL